MELPNLFFNLHKGANMKTTIVSVPLVSRAYPTSTRTSVNGSDEHENQRFPI